MDMSRLGVFVRQNLGPKTSFYVQAELDRSIRNAHYGFENLQPTTYPLDFIRVGGVASIRRYNLNLLLGYRVPHTPIRLLAGPVIGYNPRQAMLHNNGYPDMSLGAPYYRIDEAFINGFHRFGLGYQLGAGLEFWRLSVDLRRELSLTPVVSRVRYEGQSYQANVTSRLWMVTIGARLWDFKASRAHTEASEATNE